jgi:FAD/FMN-containing dehydrogenase
VVGPWRNWSGDVSCRPRRVERPVDEAGVVDAVCRAAADGLVLRAVGSSHSFTPLCVTDGVQLDLGALNRLVDVAADGVARVQAGMTLHDLSAALHAHGRALENLGDIDKQTVAGALATATHGTGARFRNL